MKGKKTHIQHIRDTLICRIRLTTESREQPLKKQKLETTFKSTKRKEKQSRIENQEVEDCSTPPPKIDYTLMATNKKMSEQQVK